MKKSLNIALLLSMFILGLSTYSQAISITIGTGDNYSNVGDYDYLPYAMNAGPMPGLNSLSFRSAMGDYGTWVSMQPFGSVWRPDVAAGWRPYQYGHWSYTQYGNTWQGYEPWAWAGYHYGNWVFNQQYGWVWIPGYEWHPGRVAWAHGYDSIGWMPMPPAGYDYSRGYLAYMGPQNQFSYYDDDFAIGLSFGGNDPYYNSGPYYDPRYRNMYYNPGYLGLVSTLWGFMDTQYYGYDNYAAYYGGDDFSRTLFDQRLVRISTRPLERAVIERIVRKPVTVRQAVARDIQIDGRRVRVAAIQGEEELIRKNANETVREVIAPAFAKKGKPFKAERAKTRQGLVKGLRLEDSPNRVQTVSEDEIIRESSQRMEQKKQQRARLKENKKQELVQIRKEGKIREPNENRSNRPDENPSNRPTDDQQDRRNRPSAEEERQNNPSDQQDRRNRPSDVEQQNQRKPERPVDRQDNPDEMERRNRPQPNPDEDLRLKDRERRNVPPPQDENVQRDLDLKDQPVESDQVQKDNQDKEQTDTKSNKSKKSKTKKSKERDKNQDEEDKPPQE